MLFNMFDVPWTYESKRFNLPSGSYLPDFYMIDWNVWIEIKGPAPTEHEKRLCEELSLVTRQTVVIAYGWPPTLLVWSGGTWVKCPPFGLANTRLILGGKPLPTIIYDEISQKIWSQSGKRKSVRTQKSKKR